MKQFTSAASRTCPNCGSDAVVTRVLPDRFVYGTGRDQVELESEIPFHKCEACQFEFTAADAEHARHEAVCRHLNVHTPVQIVALRDWYDLTQEDFAKLTRFGVASLSRWETGQLIQNGANDQLLYLLHFKENVERLRNRSVEGQTVPITRHEPVAARTHRFRALKMDQGLRRRSERFDLRCQRRA